MTLIMLETKADRGRKGTDGGGGQEGQGELWERTGNKV